MKNFIAKLFFITISIICLSYGVCYADLIGGDSALPPKNLTPMDSSPISPSFLSANTMSMIIIGVTVLILVVTVIIVLVISNKDKAKEIKNEK